MTSYSEAAQFYDILYQGEKDHAAEADVLAQLIRERVPTAATLLDVGCGTGSHARALIDAGFTVDGVDLEPAFVELARAKCPEGTFYVGDMTALDLPKRYDVVTCLFSAIGYAQSETALRRAIVGMRRHLNPGGVLLVDPWFEPGQLTHGWISVLAGTGADVTVCRMSRTLIEGTTSRLEFEYLIGRSSGIERRRETHTLSLFTQAQMEAAFAAAHLSVTRKPAVLRTRGLYIAQSEAARTRGGTA
jgi:dTDP-3-amino-3,4,6-trideoxy-alpha-D-glucopyranose N,N-dimethyltransferase